MSEKYRLLDGQLNLPVATLQACVSYFDNDSSLKDTDENHKRTRESLRSAAAEVFECLNSIAGLETSEQLLPGNPGINKVTKRTARSLLKRYLDLEVYFEKEHDPPTHVINERMRDIHKFIIMTENEENITREQQQLQVSNSPDDSIQSYEARSKRLHLEWQQHQVADLDRKLMICSADHDATSTCQDQSDQGRSQGPELDVVLTCPADYDSTTTTQPSEDQSEILRTVSKIEGAVLSDRYSILSREMNQAVSSLEECVNYYSRYASYMIDDDSKRGDMRERMRSAANGVFKCLKSISGLDRCQQLPPGTPRIDDWTRKKAKRLLRGFIDLEAYLQKENAPSSVVTNERIQDMRQFLKNAAHEDGLNQPQTTQLSNAIIRDLMPWRRRQVPDLDVAFILFSGNSITSTLVSSSKEQPGQASGARSSKDLASNILKMYNLAESYVLPGVLQYCIRYFRDKEGYEDCRSNLDTMRCAAALVYEFLKCISELQNFEQLPPNTSSLHGMMSRRSREERKNLRAYLDIEALLETTFGPPTDDIKDRLEHMRQLLTGSKPQRPLLIRKELDATVRVIIENMTRLNQERMERRRLQVPEPSTLASSSGDQFKRQGPQIPGVTNPDNFSFKFQNPMLQQHQTQAKKINPPRNNDTPLIQVHMPPKPQSQPIKNQPTGDTHEQHRSIHEETNPNREQGTSHETHKQQNVRGKICTIL